MNYIRNIALTVYFIVFGTIFWYVAPYKWSALYFITAVYCFFKLKKRLQHGT